MIVSGSASQSLAAELAAELGAELSAVDYQRFPDGELLAAAPGFSGDRAVVVASTTSAEAHVELLQLQDAVREAGAREVVTVLPYMGYARQDEPMAPGKTPEESPPGYPLSARAVARAVSVMADRVITVNPHEEVVSEFFSAPAESVDAAGLLADPLPADLADPLFLAPDEGATDLARAARDGYGAGSVEAFEKTRLSGSEVEVTGTPVDLAGRDVVLVDDIVATGSTMSESIALIDEAGAARVYATCVHPLLVGGALVRLRKAGVEAVYGTDTVERSVSAVSAAPAIADALD